MSSVDLRKSAEDSTGKKQTMAESVERLSIPTTRPSHWKQQSDEAVQRMKRQLSRGDGLSVEEAMRQFKLMEAIRAGDLNELSSILQRFPSHQPAGYGTALHLAASFGPKQVLQHLLSLKSAQPPVLFNTNARDYNGNTALHLAARGGRAALMEILLKEEDVDCSLKNSDGKDVKDVAAESVKALIEQYRSQYVQQKTLQMHQFASQSDLFSLQQLFSTHRALALVDINSPDPITGEPILHKGAEKGNVEMVTWCLKMKADPLARDKRGRSAMDFAKQDKIKQLLKGVLSQISFSSPTNSSVRMQGVLYKWTNYASGYKKRWFVLEDGVLSYYKSHEDVPVSCRGSLSLQVAKLWIDASDKNRFDIIAPGNVRFHLRAEHPTEAKRWVIALTEAKQWLQDNSEFQNQVNLKNMSINTKSHHDIVEPDGKSEISLGSPVQFDDEMSDDDETSDNESVSPAMLQFSENVNAAINLGLANVHYQSELFTTAIRTFSHSLDSAIDLQSQQTHLTDTFGKSSESIIKALREISKLVEHREMYWNNRLVREQELKRVWQENLHALAKEHDELQTKANLQMSVLEKASRVKVGTSPNGSSLSLSPNGNVQTDDEEDEFFDAVDDYKRDQRAVSAADQQNAPEALIKSSLNGYPEKCPDGFRKLLPLAAKETVKNEMSLWSVLKNNIGKDLSKIALPVFFNEPLSMLQRLCEDMEYATLLDIASTREDPLERIQFVAAFAMSNYSSTLGRTGKPFNPLLGETFEYVRKDRGYRYLAEQVSHHPPISACYCESDSYVYWAQAHIKNRFLGNSLEIQPQGGCHLILKKTNEHFSWRKVTTSVNNLIYGKLWIDHYGDMIIKNHATGDTCTVTFKAAGWRGKGQFEVIGKVTPSGSDKPTHELSGMWHERLTSKALGSSDGKSQNVVLWKRTPLPQGAEKMFNFTEFAATLNDCPTSLQPLVCQTDSRLRPDQRAMEEGRFDDADKEKIVVEERQRRARHKRNEEGFEWAPAWFYLDIEENTGEQHWVYKGGYWESREKQQWPKESADIFGLHETPADGSAEQEGQS